MVVPYLNQKNDRNDIEFLKEIQKDFDKKFQKNKTDGLKALASGNWNSFKGFSFELLNNEELAALVFSEESKAIFDEKVLSPVQELCGKHGLEAIYAGINDRDPHVTLDVAKIEFDDYEVRQMVVDELHSPESGLKELGADILSKSFTLDRLVIQPSNIYICSSKVDQSQTYPRRFRDSIEKIWDDIGAKYKDHGTFGKKYAQYNDIFHVSIARITSESTTTEHMMGFCRELYETLDIELSENPLKINTDIVKFVNAAEDLQREIFNMEGEGKSLETTLLNGVPDEWVEKQRESVKKNNEPYLNRPLVII